MRPDNDASWQRCVLTTMRPDNDASGTTMRPGQRCVRDNDASGATMRLGKRCVRDNDASETMTTMRLGWPKMRHGWTKMRRGWIKMRPELTHDRNRKKKFFLALSISCLNWRYSSALQVSIAKLRIYIDNYGVLRNRRRHMNKNVLLILDLHARGIPLPVNLI